MFDVEKVAHELAVIHASNVHDTSAMVGSQIVGQKMAERYFNAYTAIEKELQKLITESSKDA